MRDRERRIVAFLLAVGLALTLLGQTYFAWRRAYVWDGVVFYALGASLWAAALRRLEAGPRRPVWPLRALRAAATRPLRAALSGAGALMAVGAGIAAVRTTPGADFTPHLLAWALGLCLFLIGLAPVPERERWLRLMGLARTHRMELIALTALLLVALTIRAVAMDAIPANFGGDEGTQALAALRLIGPPLGNPFSTGWYSVPTMSFLAYGLAMRVFGPTVAGVRALSALIGTATVLATFLLARELAGRWVGYIAATLVACGHYGIHFSRLASNQVADGLFGALALYLLLRGLSPRSSPSLSGQSGRGSSGRGRASVPAPHRGSSGRGSSGRASVPAPHQESPLLALAGVVLGLSWYGYFGSRLMTIVVGLYLAWRALAEPRFLARQGRGIGVLIAGALLAMSPLAFHYLAHPAELFSRYNQVSIFASGWLEREVVITGRSATSLLLDQFWKSVSAFNLTPDPTFWYRPGVPLLDPVSGVFFVLGLTAATVKRRRPTQGLLLLWFWSFVLLGWTLTENPPSSQRGMVALPVVAILTALGLAETGAVVRRLLARRDHEDRNNLLTVASAGAPGQGNRRRRRYGAATVGLVLCIIAVVNLGFYFGVYTPRRVYGNPTAEVADVLCDVLEVREGIPPIYFDGAPVMYWDFGAIGFRLREVEGENFSPGEGLEGVDLSPGALFVVL
ncbi:MAG TPA: phospholipid carrier-dependent glycosyltransferase, partial [Chloroflexi bacterium]|nr:phospholipid carrier-dependent glycosyltransferase [Chloroflexota bacterium]